MPEGHIGEVRVGLSTRWNCITAYVMLAVSWFIYTRTKEDVWEFVGKIKSIREGTYSADAWVGLFAFSMIATLVAGAIRVLVSASSNASNASHVHHQDDSH